MADLQNLSIVIDVMDSFSEELNDLLQKLAEVKVAMEAVDDTTITVDVNDSDVDALMAKMAMLEAGSLGGGRDVGGGGFDVGGGRRGGINADFSGVIDRLDVIGDELFDFSEQFNESISKLSSQTDDVSRSMGKAADAADKASEGFLKGDLRMTDLHNALARLVPLLLVFIGALPALMGAMVALAAAAVAAAGALATLTGFAALGLAIQMGDGDISEGFQKMFQDVQDSFMEAFKPIAERLAPLFEDGLEGLEMFFQAVANQSDAFMALTDDAREFGAFILNTIPSALGDMARFVDAMAEVFALLTRMGAEIQVFEILAGFIVDVLPAFIKFIKLLGALIPHLMQMSVGFLQAANGVMQFLNILIDVITLGGMFNEQLGFIVGSILAAYSATLLLNSALGTFAFGMMVKATSAVLGAIQAFTGYNVAATLATLSTWQLYAAVVALATVLTLGFAALIGVFGGIASAAGGASNKIDEATKSLKQFESQRQGMASGTNPYKEPDIQRGQNLGGTPSANQVNINVEGDASAETLRNQTNNALYKLERPARKK